ncbi:phenylacetate-CoA oxygenase/reductase subunit PaaK [Jiangella aurantiaca]|uniref:Phenylacetate-CoA oxygenase/reductase subunit PaaK n=1 Tax=Jiangella aurantiaca TaxID=2530373 RepID=A0A4R5A8Y1_9ACTN|nr:1,2-phenylacetyl-CoA epoxidase subunit PaaE [Jiangella aurantiaca]TDD68738.1 phenylacetate-CoA oxygenase/reductase subunit PaaK [Jiangella aurantiaca]
MTTTTAAPRTERRRHSVTHRLRVAAVDRLTDDAVAVTFAVPAELAADYDFAAGQHVNVALPGGDGVRRSYSICSPAGSGVLRIAVKRIPGGVFSSHALTTLAAGDEVDVMTPAGRFTPSFDPDQAKHYALVAAGSGITPVLSIVATALATEPGSRVTLLYGNRTSSSVMFLDELADLKDRHPDRLQLVHLLSREPGSTELLSGRIDGERLGRLLDTLLPPETVDDWYLCGPYELITTARDVLSRRGVERAHVHAELYHVGDPPPAIREEARLQAVTCAVTASLDGRRTEVTVDDPDETVLEAVLRVRNDAPFACKGGVCGTCRAKVVDGAVTMERRYALEDDEIAAGYVLTCQSHPTTPTLEVDYDA